MRIQTLAGEEYYVDGVILFAPDHVSFRSDGHLLVLPFDVIACIYPQ